MILKCIAASALITLLAVARPSCGQGLPFESCLNGPTVAAPVGCEQYDATADGFVDMADVLSGQVGTGVAARDTTCTIDNRNHAGARIDQAEIAPNAGFTGVSADVDYYASALCSPGISSTASASSAWIGVTEIVDADASRSRFAQVGWIRGQNFPQHVSVADELPLNQIRRPVL